MNEAIKNDDVPQPDVLSGLENVSIGQHLEPSPPASDLSNPDQPESSIMSKSSSSDFESIYDKYKSDEEAGGGSHNIPIMDSSSSTLEPPASPSEMEIEAVVEQEPSEGLKSDENRDEALASVEEIGDGGGNENSESVNLGARPKEFQTASGSTDTVPDLVMDTAFEEEQQKYGTSYDDSIPKESPPPYSEVDPLKKERPKTLDIPKEDANETADEQNTEPDAETTSEG